MAKKNLTYQIEIDFGNTNLNDSSFGILGGVMYLTTGEDYTYNSISYVSKILTARSVPSYREYADLQSGGAYANFSTINVSLNLTTGLLDYLRTNSVIIRGARVVYKHSIDRATPVADWVGKVDDHSMTRGSLTLVCVDDFNAIHSTQPSAPISSKSVSSSNEDPIPLVIGQDDYAELVPKSANKAFNFNLKTGGPSLASNNVQIVGYAADTSQEQGPNLTAQVQGRFFHPKSWNTLILYCGENSTIQAGALTDYTLTFKNEIDGNQFFAKIRSSSASTAFVNRPQYYYVEVILDKAVPFELEEIPDDQLYPGWPTGDEELTITTNRTNPLPLYYRYSRAVVSSTFSLDGRIMAFSGRRWANVDKLDPGVYQYDKAYYPLNLPTSCPSGDGLTDFGTIQWEPIERISKVAFKPLTWIGWEFDENYVPFSENKTASNYLGDPIVTQAEMSSFQGEFLADETTLATLIHNDAFADFWLAENGINAFSANAPIYNESGDSYLREFDYENGVIKVDGPEWGQRLGEFEADFSENAPVKNSYPVYGQFLKSAPIVADRYLAHSPSQGVGIWNDIIVKYGTDLRVDFNQFACSGRIDDTTGKTFDFPSNEGEEWKGSTSPVTYKYTTDLTFTEITANGRVPELKEKGVSEGPYFRSASDYLLEFVFQNFEDQEFSFLGRIFFNTSQSGLTGFTEWNAGAGLDLLNVYCRIYGYGENPYNVGASPDYDSKWVSLASVIVAEGLFNSISGANEMALLIGNVSFDLPNMTYIIGGNIPNTVKEAAEGFPFVKIQIMVGCDSKDNVQIGLQPSFVNMVKFDKSTDGNYASVGSETSQGLDDTTYPDAVLEVIEDFDKAPLKIDYERGSLSSTYSAGGGGNPIIGRQFTQSEDTFRLCQQLAKRGFFGITIDNQGKRVLKPWLYNSSPVKKFSTTLQAETPSTPWAQPIATTSETFTSSRGIRSKIWNVNDSIMGFPAIKTDNDSSEWYFYLTDDGGDTWFETARIGNEEFGSPVGVAYGNGTWVVVGGSSSNDGARSWKSTDDGNNWQRHEIDSYRWRDPDAIYFLESAGLFIVSCSTTSSTRFYSSPDGENWTARTSSLSNIGSCEHLGFDGSRVVALGRFVGGTGTKVFSTADGVTWEEHDDYSAIYPVASPVGEDGFVYAVLNSSGTTRVLRNSYPYNEEDWEEIYYSNYREFGQMDIRDGVFAVFDKTEDAVMWTASVGNSLTSVSLPSGWNNALYGFVIRPDRDAVLSHRLGDVALLNLNGYSAGDEVGHEGDLYRSLTNNNPFTPGASDEWFFVMALAYTPIKNETLNRLETVSYSSVYTHADIRYAAGPTGKTQEYLIVDRTEEETFPDATTYTDLGAEVTGLAASYDYSAQLVFVDILNASIPSDWTPGAILNLTFSASVTYSFKISGITVIDASNSRFYLDSVVNIGPIAGPIDSARTSSGLLEWQTFVKASEKISYGDAKILWESFRAAYERRGGRNDLASDLANAPELKADINRLGVNVLEYTKNLVNWVTFSKEKTSFKTDIITGLELRMLDPVFVRDPILTSGVDFLGWVYGKNPNQESSECTIEVIFDKSPFDPVEETGIIDEGVDIGTGVLPFDDIDELIDNGVDPLPVDDIDEGAQ